MFLTKFFKNTKRNSRIEDKINSAIDQSIETFGIMDYEFCFNELLKECPKLKSSIFEECVENRGGIDFEYCFFVLKLKLLR